MNLYEIDAAMTDLCDPETGEIMDMEAFQALEMERGRKLENMACWIKDLDAEERAIQAEERALKARREAARGKRERLTAYLREMLNGETFKTARVDIRYQRNPPSVHVDNDADLISWALLHDRKDLLKVTTEISKNSIMSAIKAGEEIPGAEVVQETRMVVR